MGNNRFNDDLDKVRDVFDSLALIKDDSKKKFAGAIITITINF